jgi:sporulation protein YlmC with PRC-barrel domain
MKSFKLVISIVMMLGLLAALPAFATQDDSSSSSSATNPNQAANPSNSTSRPTAQSMDQSQIAKPQENSLETAGNFPQFRADDLIGKSVKDQDGNGIGKVADLVIGKDGQADFVVLSHGGILWFGEKYTPVPFQTFMSNATNIAKLNSDSDVTTKLSKAKIDSAPEFSDRHWDLSGSQGKICSYFGQGLCSFM